MSEILMIVPSDWIEIPNVTQYFIYSVNETDMSFLIDGKNWEAVSGFLDSIGFVAPENKVLVNAQLQKLPSPISTITTEDDAVVDIVHRMWVRYE